MITLGEFEEEWLESIREGNPSTTVVGYRFAQKILRDWHEIDSDSAEIIHCDGAGDGGIDAAVFIAADPSEGIAGDTWLLVQSKFGSSLAGAAGILQEGQKLIATLQGRAASLSGLSREVVGRIRTFIENQGPNDRLEYVLTSSRRLSEAETEMLDTVRLMGRERLLSRFTTDSVSIETLYNRVLEEDASPGPTGPDVWLETSVIESTDVLHVGVTKLPSLFTFLKDYKSATGDLDLLYERNVRQFLGSGRRVNRGIEKTLEDHPERFGIYNNGVTIVAERILQEDGRLCLTRPYVVNGCQTTRSIWNVLQRKFNAGGSEPSEAQLDWERRLKSGVVVTKIVIVGDEGDQLLTDTTRYTNSQNAVGEKDFIALEKEFREWAPAFNRRYRIFLEIQRGAWEARRAFQRQHPEADPRFTEAANAFELLKAYAAGWMVEPGIAYGKNPPFAPGGTLFNKIVNQPGFSIESLYAAHLLNRLATQLGFGRSATHSSRGQTRFLFIMAAVDLIRDRLLHLTKDTSPEKLTASVLAIDEAGLLEALGEAAVHIIDDYLTPDAEDSIFFEPEFRKSHDLNAFLKSDKLAKSDDFSPSLRSQLTIAKKLFRRAPNASAFSEALSLV